MVEVGEWFGGWVGLFYVVYLFYLIFMIDFFIMFVWVGCLCDIVDFFKFGILFKDIMLLLVNGEDFVVVVDVMVVFWCDVCLVVVMGIELCGFILGVVMVWVLGVGFVLVCKLGKLFGWMLK